MKIIFMTILKIFKREGISAEGQATMEPFNGMIDDPFLYQAGLNLPLAIIKWLRGEEVSADMLQPEYGRMFAKNDYLMEVK